MVPRDRHVLRRGRRQDHCRKQGRQGSVLCQRGSLTPQEFTRQVTTEEGQAFAERMGTLFMGKRHRARRQLTCPRVLRQDAGWCQRRLPGPRATSECQKPAARDNACDQTDGRHGHDSACKLPTVTLLIPQILETPSLWTRGPQPVRTPNVQLQEDAPGYLSGCSC